jgi:hypothetical protein
LSLVSATGEAQLSLVSSADLKNVNVVAERDPFFEGLVLNLDEGASDDGLDELLFTGGTVALGGALVRVKADPITAGLIAAAFMHTGETLYRHLRSVDIDANDKTDVLAVGFISPDEPMGGAPPSEPKTRVTVFLNDGQGGLCWGGSASCQPIELDVGATVIDVDWINYDGDAAKEIVALTPKEVLILDFVESAGSSCPSRKAGPRSVVAT